VLQGLKENTGELNFVKYHPDKYVNTPANLYVVTKLLKKASTEILKILAFCRKKKNTPLLSLYNSFFCV